MRIYTTDPRKGHQVLAGEYDEETKTFTRHVKPEHFVRVGQGYAIQQSVIDQLATLGCLHVILILIDGKKIPSEFWHWTGERSFAKNLGHGWQRILPLKVMDGHYDEVVPKKKSAWEFTAHLDDDATMKFVVKAKDEADAENAARKEVSPKLMIRLVTDNAGRVIFKRAGYEIP
jgi:hypothetical protein